MPITNVKAEWSNGSLVFKDSGGNTLLTFAESGITFASGKTTSISGTILVPTIATSGSDPSVAGQLYNSGGIMKISAG